MLSDAQWLQSLLLPITSLSVLLQSKYGIWSSTTQRMKFPSFNAQILPSLSHWKMLKNEAQVRAVLFHFQWRVLNVQNVIAEERSGWEDWNILNSTKFETFTHIYVTLCNNHWFTIDKNCCVSPKYESRHQRTKDNVHLNWNAVRDPEWRSQSGYVGQNHNRFSSVSEIQNL